MKEKGEKREKSKIWVGAKKKFFWGGEIYYGAPCG